MVTKCACSAVHQMNSAQLRAQADTFLCTAFCVYPPQYGREQIARVTLRENGSEGHLEQCPGSAPAAEIGADHSRC